MYQINSLILFRSKNLHVSDSLSVHHQELKTVHTATGICQTDTADCLLASRHSIYFTYACCCMYSLEILMMDGMTFETCRMLLQNKINKFEILVHLVGFTTEIYYDARPYERQISLV